MLKKLIKKLWLKADQNLWDANVAEEKAFLARFPEPATPAQRSYYQYLCQNLFYAGFRLTVWKVIAFFALPCFFVLLLLKGCKKVQKTPSTGVFMGGISLPYVRKTIEKECSEWAEMSVLGEMGITGKDIKFFLPLWFRYFFSPLFTLKVLMKLARYSWVIRKYSPQIIMTEEESSFPSSLMTGYCHIHNIRHYFAMHGEILFMLRNTFAEFDRYYVWDEEYKKLLISLRCPQDKEYCIIRPDFHHGIDFSKAEKEFDCTYYMQSEDCVSLQKKHDYLVKLREKNNWKIAVRPHPRYTDMEAFACIFSDFEREDVKTLTFDASLARTKNVLSFYSTVLFQAYLCDINAIIDDVFSPEKIKTLAERGYIMTKLGAGYLSDKLQQEQK